MPKKSKNPCLTYDCWDSDREGCTMPHSDKWYACPIESAKPENQKALEEMPAERKQCEIIWQPVYDEYRRIGYRLKKGDKDADSN